MKRNLIKAAAGILASVLMFSCATTNSAEAGSRNSDLIVRGTENPSELKKNEIMSVTTKVNSPEYYEFSNWSKIRMMNGLLDELKLHKDLTNEQKYELMSFIFDELPKNGKDGIAREVRLGKFFTEQKGDAQNLVIRVGLMTPAKDAQKKNERIMILVSNAIKNPQNGEILKGAGSFISYDINATVIAAYNNNLLTDIQKMTAENNNKADVSNMEDLSAVMLSQSILADEDLSNDSTAHELCTAIMNKNDIMPAVKIMAMLMEYDYRISLEDVDGASALWDDILEFCVNVPGDMTPENLNATNGESLYLLRELLK